MAVHYQDVEARWFAPPAALLRIEGGTLYVTAGYWPDVGGAFARVGEQQVTLSGDAQAVLIKRLAREVRQYEGEANQCAVVTAATVPPYGVQPVGGGRFRILEYVDLLAWREGVDWHVKRLVQGEG